MSKISLKSCLITLYQIVLVELQDINGKTFMFWKYHDDLLLFILFQVHVIVLYAQKVLTFSSLCLHSPHK